jgi:hypothetical protein
MALESSLPSQQPQMSDVSVMALESSLPSQQPQMSDVSG